jgi:hypothetical protein
MNDAREAALTQKVLVLAASGGFCGFVVTAMTGSAIFDGRYDVRDLATLGVLGAGVGWLLGATVGLVLTGATPPRTTAEAWILRATAVLFVIAGLMTPWWSVALPHEISWGDPLLRPMQRSIWFDSAVAATTCLVLAQRRYRREALVIGAVASIGILVSAIFVFSWLPFPSD